MRLRYSRSNRLPRRKKRRIPGKSKPVIIKKYANRRLYNTETSSYVTLEDLGEMVRSERDFLVYDAKTGEDLTHTVLTQIIVEEEGKNRLEPSAHRLFAPAYPFLRPFD